MPLARCLKASSGHYSNVNKQRGNVTARRGQEASALEERMLDLGYICDWPPANEQRPLRAFKTGERAAGKGSKASGSSGRIRAVGSPSFSIASSSTSAYRAIAPAVVTADEVAQSAAGYLPSEAATGSPASSSIASYPPPLPDPSTSSCLPPSSSLPITANCLLPSSDLPAFSSSATLAPPLNLNLDFSLDPSTSYFNPGEELSNFFATLDSEFGDFGKWDAMLTETPSWADSPAGLSSSGVQAGSVSSTPASLPHASTSTRQTRREEEAEEEEEEEEGILARDYHQLNESFFESLPKPARKVICSMLLRTATSTVLSRNAGMAMVMLYRLRQHQQQQVSTNPAEAAAAAELQRKLTEAGNCYYSKALGSLSGKEVPFEAKFLATLDLMTYQFDQYGSAACHAVVVLAEFFIIEHLGPQPTLQLSPLQDDAHAMLYLFAWTDVLRSMVTPKRRILFNYPSLPGDSPSPWILPPCAISTHLGFPVHLMLCFASIANLGAEMDALPDAVVQVKADAIEQAIRDWRFPSPPDAQEPADGVMYLEKVGTAEMWRHAALLYLYQSLGRGPLSSGVLASAKQILDIGSRLLHPHTSTSSLLDSPSASDSPTRSSSTVPNTSSRTRNGEYISSALWRDGPFFLAGAVSTLPRDRELCRQGVKACGRMQGYQDNLIALERIWKEVDEKGWLFDWRVFLQEQNLFVGFI
ncbi:hypothetical protein JCM11641_001869 [Rhodosporidiobolus odoratus]